MAINIRVSISLAWQADEFPDLFWSNNRWNDVYWMDYDNIFYTTIFEGRIYYVSKICNDNGKYLIIKAIPPGFLVVQTYNQVHFYFDYQVFFRYQRVREWLIGFNEDLFQ